MATALAGKLFIVNKALCADKYTATLTSCAHSYLSTKGKNMEKTVLNEVYDLLKKIGAVDNESEFSTDWLARSECYMRTLDFKQPNPSVVHYHMCKQASALCQLNDGDRRTCKAGQAVY